VYEDTIRVKTKEGVLAYSTTEPMILGSTADGEIDELSTKQRRAEPLGRIFFVRANRSLP